MIAMPRPEETPRYRALARGMQRARGGAFDIAIEGEDQLHFASHDAVAMEAANTAFQVHVSTQPDEFAALFRNPTALHERHHRTCSPPP